MFLIYDCETNGKWDFKAGAEAPHQPRIMQLAALLTDPAGKTLASFEALIIPDGYEECDPGALAVHGISVQDCCNHGISAQLALNMLLRMMDRAKFVVGHNENFDRNMVTRECLYLGLPNIMEGRARYCTMELTTEELKLPGKFGKYKWPKLAEAYEYYFGGPPAVAHDAMADVISCKDVFFQLGIAPF